MVAQQILILFVKVRILARLPSIMVDREGSNLGSSAFDRKAVHNLRIKGPPSAQTESILARLPSINGRSHGFEPWFERL